MIGKPLSIKSTTWATNIDDHCGSIISCSSCQHVMGSKNGFVHALPTGSGTRLPWRQRLRARKGSANSQREGAKQMAKKSFVGGDSRGVEEGRRSDATPKLFRLELMKRESQLVSVPPRFHSCSCFVPIHIGIELPTNLLEG